MGTHTLLRFFLGGGEILLVFLSIWVKKVSHLTLASPSLPYQVPMNTDYGLWLQPFLREPGILTFADTLSQPAEERLLLSQLLQGEGRLV